MARARCSSSATRRASPYPAWYMKLAGIVNQGAFPGMFGGGMGQLALNQLLVTMDGIDNPPVLASLLDEPDQQPPRRVLRRPAPDPEHGAPLPGSAAGRQPDLLHRGDERAARVARPGDSASGPHGPPRLVPDAHEARPRGHLRALSRQGLARPRARLRPGTRRARPDHERVLAGDGRAGLLDGADSRPPRGRDSSSRATTSSRR